MCKLSPSISSYGVPDLDAVRYSLRAHGEDKLGLDDLVLSYTKVGKRGPKLFLFERPGAGGEKVYVSAVRLSPARANEVIVDLNQRTATIDNTCNSRSEAARAVAYFDAALGLLFQPFPLDRRLARLKHAASAFWMKPVFERLLVSSVDHTGLRAVRVEVMRYKPERKCTFRYRLEWECTDTRPTVIYGKLSRASSYRRTCGLLDEICTIANPTGFHLPALIGKIPRWCMEFYSEVPGSTLVSLYADSDFTCYCERAARCLHSFHSVAVMTGERSDVRAQLDQLTEDTAGIVRLLPDEAESVRCLSQRIGVALRAQGAPDVACLHGDFHGSNVLVSGQRLGLIDLEDCVRGDPAEDIGSMCAYLVLMALQRPGYARELDIARHAFVAAYPGSRRFLTRIAVHTSLYCFYHAFQRLRHPHEIHHREHARRLLSTSRDMLDKLAP